MEHLADRRERIKRWCGMQKRPLASELVKIGEMHAGAESFIVKQQLSCEYEACAAVGLFLYGQLWETAVDAACE